jgi:hypothetical protein
VNGLSPVICLFPEYFVVLGFLEILVENNKPTDRGTGYVHIAIQLIIAFFWSLVTLNFNLQRIGKALVFHDNITPFILHGALSSDAGTAVQAPLQESKHYEVNESLVGQVREIFCDIVNNFIRFFFHSFIAITV